MNVANLQMQGLVVAVASLNQMLVRRGLISIDDVDDALHRAEANLASEERTFEDLPPANRDALLFPIRILRAANRSQGGQEIPPFSELAKSVGREKRPYGDQV
jgi:hypothetical protein